MKKSLLIAVSVVLLIGFISCSTMDSPKNALNWAGVYTGIIPAASASGIDVEITLNSDNTYKVIYRYIDRSNASYVHIGDFKWDNTGNIITLSGKEIPPFYKVEENVLIQLDLKRKIIQGEFAENYKLRK